MDRRKFAKTSLMVGVTFSVTSGFSFEYLADGNILDNITAQEVRQFLSKILYTKEEVDDYFDGRAFPFSKHSAEFGWLLQDSYFQDGINNSISAYNYVKPDGERIMTNYSELPCRVNTYGNSFTQCHQVSDHETWQEVLAAHIQEPVKNFGIGGWSVYQAYLRLLKEEKRTPAEYLILNIYSDDHYRNLDSWRNIRKNKHIRFIEPPLPYMRVDLKNKIISEHPNPTPTREDFYKLCDIEETFKLFKDDFVAKVLIAHNKSREQNENLKYKDIQKLTQTHGIETELDNNPTMSKVVEVYHQDCALFSTINIIEKLEKYAFENKKKILYVLSYPAGYLAKVHDEHFRWDQSLIDFINSKNLPLVDLGQSHFDDFKQFNLSFKEYLKKYFIGHYNPLGNMFCATAINTKLVEIMDPKPIPYNENTKLGSF